MTSIFWIFTSAMLLFASGALWLLPRIWRHQIAGDSTADWVKLRSGELDEEDADLHEEVAVRAYQDLAEAKSNAPADTTRRGETQLGAKWHLCLALIIATAAIALYGSLGSLEDERIKQQLTQLDAQSPDNVESVMRRIAARVTARPDNLDYQALLAQFYAAKQDYSAALSAYDAILERIPDNADTLARAAQAEFLASERQLSQRAERRAASALAADPNQRTALGVLGMAAYEAEQYADALLYWQRLQSLEPEGTPAYDMMAQVIASASAKIEGDEASAPPSTTQDTSPSSPGVRVTIDLPVGAKVPASAAVFVIARPAGASSRMPTAVVKMVPSAWPVSVRLSDNDAMAGQRLSSMPLVDIEVQISPSGRPGKQNATWLALANNVIPSTTAAVSVVLSRTSEISKPTTDSAR